MGGLRYRGRDWRGVGRAPRMGGLRARQRAVMFGPVRIQGKPTPVQARLVRCYVWALAHRDTAALLAVAPATPPVRITKADLTHSADARSGRATATFLPALVDSD